MGLRVGVEEGQAMILSLETLLPSRNSRFLTQINRIGKRFCRYAEIFSQPELWEEFEELDWASGGKLDGAKLGG
jgi:hypothetical protein